MGPLPAVVAVQQKLAPKLGGKAMMLVSAHQAELTAAKQSVQIWRFRPAWFVRRH
jgi:hypothetical protein